jgi:hypothetical protein
MFFMRSNIRIREWSIENRHFIEDDDVDDLGSGGVWRTIVSDFSLNFPEGFEDYAWELVYKGWCGPEAHFRQLATARSGSQRFICWMRSRASASSRETPIR